MRKTELSMSGKMLHRRKEEYRKQLWRRRRQRRRTEFLGGKLQERKPFGRPRYRAEDNTEQRLKDVGGEDMNWS
jgi:hypothetical protein